MEIEPNVKQWLTEPFSKALKDTVPTEGDVIPLIAISKSKFGDYQCNNAMSLYGKVRKTMPEFTSPLKVAEAIMENLPESEMIESCSVTRPGFVNVVLSRKWLAKRIQKMLVEGIEIWAPKLSIKRVVVDFSSPNIAKEMHVGHLRSTIIGDTIARLLEFSGVDQVLRRNHLGDWGTQFGMLIEFLFEKFPQWEDANEIPIKDLQNFYKQSTKRFKDDAIFKERAQKAVVKLQGGEPKYRKAWAEICEISRKEFQKVYERLGIHNEEKGESFYNPYIPIVLKDLRDQGLIEKSKGAKVIRIVGHEKPQSEGAEVIRIVGHEKPQSEGAEVIRIVGHEKPQSEGAEVIRIVGHEKPQSEGAEVIRIVGHEKPLIVVKSDGGYNYATTDLTALWYRLNEEKAEWIIYVTADSQRVHFEKCFQVARRAGWLPHDDTEYPKVTHVGHGVVKGDDGKPYQTRSSEVVLLVDLLDEAKNRSKQDLIDRGKASEWTEEELEQTAAAVGYGAVKFFDLYNNRLTDYTFNYDKMLNPKGRTAVYLLYAHARICSVLRKSDIYTEKLKKDVEIVLDHPDERALGLHLAQFSEIIEEACCTLLPSALCEYLYTLSELFSTFYKSCKVHGSAEETSRLLLSEATAVVMRKCLELLGITPVYKL